MFPMNVISAPNFSSPTDSYVQHQQRLLFTWITKLFLGDDIEASFTSHGPPFLSTRLLDTCGSTDVINGGAAAAVCVPCKL